MEAFQQIFPMVKVPSSSITLCNSCEWKISNVYRPYIAEADHIGRIKAGRLIRSPRPPRRWATIQHRRYHLNNYIDDIIFPLPPVDMTRCSECIRLYG